MKLESMRYKEAEDIELTHIPLKVKLLVPTILLIVIVIISAISFVASGSRIIITDDRTYIGKFIPEQKYVDRTYYDHSINIYDNYVQLSMFYKDAGVEVKVDNYPTGLIVQDMRGIQARAYLPSNAPFITDINDGRYTDNDGQLEITDDFELVITNTSENNIVDLGKVYLAVSSGVKNFEDISINLKDYYTEPTHTEKYERMLKSIDDYNNFKITYTNGFELTSKVLARRNLIKIDQETGAISCTITESNARDIMAKNMLDYNTLNTDFTFKNHNGKDMKIPSVTYGSYMDYDLEGAYIVDAVSEWRSETDRTPIMKQSPTISMEEAYIEVDKSEQHAYYYKNGECVWDSAVVTGLPTEKRATPSGLYFIINKAKDDVPLVGETWNTTVDRWMAVTYSGVGFHDASWRSKFGGTIYKSNGSHGCINTPKDKMFELYDIVEVGTPVVIYG